MSAKTVRNIAGLVSSAFGGAIRWGMVTHNNPVKNSEPPIPKKQAKVALTVAEQDMLIAAATGFWRMATFIEVAAALGARRGEVLALRWSDIVGGRAIIARSLSQTKAGLEFKGTKSERPRTISLTAEALAALETHRSRQDEFRAQFGSDYADLGLVFAQPDGNPLRPDSVSASISLLCRRLKLPPGASLHTLRHTHATHMLAGGVPLQASPSAWALLGAGHGGGVRSLTEGTGQ
jgi:integrase